MKKRAITTAIAIAAGSLGMTMASSLVAAQNNGLEEIVVTARKRTESLQDVGLAVSAMSETEIKRTFARDL
jgi:iron complex outermembrane receptor protein